MCGSTVYKEEGEVPQKMTQMGYFQAPEKCDVLYEKPLRLGYTLAIGQ